MVLLHLGPLHPAERILTLLLAFGPFVLLALTIWITRRRHAGVGPDPGPDADAARDEDGPVRD